MVVLATKIYVRGDARDRALRSLESLVDNEIGELHVEATFGIRHDDFPTVTLEGPDAPAARAALAEEWGSIATPLPDDEPVVGTLERWDEDGWYLDAGEEVHIPPAGLDLGVGTPVQLVERFGLVQHQRLRCIPGEEPRLAPAEVDRLYDWQRGTGRVNVNSVTRAEVRATVNRAGHADDIVTVERLGLLEQSVICTEDTDPPGLLAAIGRHLPGEMRCVMP